jgi:hypothetical protein
MTQKNENQFQVSDTPRRKRLYRNLLLSIVPGPVQILTPEGLDNTDRPTNQLREVPNTWAVDVKEVRSQTVDGYTVIMPTLAVRESIRNLLAQLEGQGEFLPHPHVTVKDRTHIKIEAVMPLAIHESDRQDEIRDLFDGLYGAEGLFVDLRIQPVQDGE